MRRLISHAARLLLAGEPDPANPAIVGEAQLLSWVEEGVVEYIGWVEDMAALWARAHIACLPSYCEGLPKALLEAMACGWPVVTTNASGCRDCAFGGDNVLLVPVRDAERLADALARLIEDAGLRQRLGARVRERAVAEFDQERVIAATLAVNESICP